MLREKRRNASFKPNRRWVDWILKSDYQYQGWSGVILNSLLRKVFFFCVREYDQLEETCKKIKTFDQKIRSIYIINQKIIIYTDFFLFFFFLFLCIINYGLIFINQKKKIGNPLMQLNRMKIFLRIWYCASSKVSELFLERGLFLLIISAFGFNTFEWNYGLNWV